MTRIVKVQARTDYGKTYEVQWSWYDGEGKRHHNSQRFRTEREAKAKRREVEQSVADANLPDSTARRSTFAEWAERWYRVKVVSSKPSTARGYRSILDSSALPAFGSRRIRSITTADLQEWVTSLQERGLTPPTIKHHHGVVASVFAFAARARAISANPARDAALPTDRSVGRRKPEPRFLTVDEVTRLAAYLDQHCPPYGLLVTFAAYTGLRAGELAGLDVGDVDPLRSVVQVRRTRRKIKGGWEVHTPKSGKARRVPMPGWLRDDLVAYLAQHPRRADAEAPLWPGRRAGGYTHGEKGSEHARPGALDYSRPWEPGAFYRGVYRLALSEVGLPSGGGGVRLHDLRHTYASLSASAGIPAYRLAEYMGHASEVITRTIYTHLFTEDSTADMDRLARPASLTPTTAATVTPLRRSTR